MDPKFNGGNPLADIAYHFLIRMDGVIQTGRDLERAGAGEPGYNKNGIHIALAGRKTFRKEQLEALESLCQLLYDEHPTACLVGHREINRGAPKTCPNLDLKWLKEIWRKWSERGKLQ
jgi:N-acetylmuramoyl-L-alanine amidase